MKLRLIVAAVALTLAAGLAQAQIPPVLPMAPPVSGTRLPAGTSVYIQLAEGLDSQNARRGQTIRIELGRDLKVGDTVILPAGAPGLGEVIDADPAERGQPGKLLIAAQVLLVDGKQVPLKGWRLHATGKQTRTVELLKRRQVWVGYPALLTAGNGDYAELAEDVIMTRDFAVTLPTPATPARLLAGIPGGLAQPPPGQGQVIFYRAKAPHITVFSAMPIHEGEIGASKGVILKLDQGRAEAVRAPPGKITFSAYGDRNDRISFDIEAGETYYVFVTYQMGAIRGIPLMLHASRADFAAIGPVADPPGRKAR